MEGKLDGVFEKVQRELQPKTTQMKKATDDMDAGLNNLNKEVQELRSGKIGENEKDMKLTNDRCLYQKVYSRRENLRFLGFPKAIGTKEVESGVVYQCL